MDAEVDVCNIRVNWDNNHDFSNHVQSYADGADFFGISRMIEKNLAGEIDCTVTCTDR